MKKSGTAYTAAFLLCLTLLFASCGGSAEEPVITGSVTPAAYDADDEKTETDEKTEGATKVELSGKSDVGITKAGTYILSGTLEDGQVTVSIPAGETVFLILDGADISCSDDAAVCILNAGKTVITLAEGSVNSITDGKRTDAAESEASGAVYSKDDLTINGTGTLTVTANYNHGIHCKNDLKIISGHITVNSANDALKGRDSVTVRSGTITLNAGGDGIQSNNADEAGKGYVIIEGGELDITAGSDGIQAETDLLVTGGTIRLLTGGGSGQAAVSVRERTGFTSPDMNSGATAEYEPAAADGGSASAKGLKSGSLITLSGCALTVDSSDDAVHSDGDVLIKSGTLVLQTGDDGIHAENAIQADGGSISVIKSYEGLESASVVLNGGEISIIASDDGINAVNGADAAAGRQAGWTVQDASVSVNGGVIRIIAAGDGLDSNGSITMTGGEITIDGPVDSGNGALDYMGTFEISGGTVIAAGSTGMAQNASSGSSQCSVLIAFTQQAGGSELVLTDSSGKTILSCTPSKTYACVLISSPELKTGESYTLTSGGQEIAAFIQTDTVTASGTFGRGQGGMPDGVQGGRPGRRA